MAEIRQIPGQEEAKSSIIFDNPRCANHFPEKRRRRKNAGGGPRANPTPRWALHLLSIWSICFGVSKSPLAHSFTIFLHLSPSGVVVVVACTGGRPPPGGSHCTGGRPAPGGAKEECVRSCCRARGCFRHKRRLQPPPVEIASPRPCSFPARVRLAWWSPCSRHAHCSGGAVASPSWSAAVAYLEPCTAR